MEDFNGLTDEQWNLIESYFPFKWGILHKGKSPIHPRKPMNTILWVLKTRAPWKDVPAGEKWCSCKSLKDSSRDWCNNKSNRFIEARSEWFFYTEKAGVKMWNMNIKGKKLLLLP